MADAFAADPWMVLALPLVLTFCWCWRERTKRKSRTEMIREYCELLRRIDP
jgi:hypothetical protein